MPCIFAITAITPRKFLAVLLSAILAACSITLVPAYDPSLVENLQKTNEKTLTLFSALATGSPSAQFAQYARTYDEIIGSFEALKIQADSRVVPALSAGTMKKLSQKSDRWADLCGDAATEASACVNPTPKIIDKIVDTVSRMRNTHRADNSGRKLGGLTADGVQLFKNDYLSSIEQALTVETALKRE